MSNYAGHLVSCYIPLGFTLSSSLLGCTCYIHLFLSGSIMPSASLFLLYPFVLLCLPDEGIGQSRVTKKSSYQKTQRLQQKSNTWSKQLRPDNPVPIHRYPLNHITSVGDPLPTFQALSNIFLPSTQTDIDLAPRNIVLVGDGQPNRSIPNDLHTLKGSHAAMFYVHKRPII